MNSPSSQALRPETGVQLETVKVGRSRRSSCTGVVHHLETFITAPKRLLTSRL